MASVQKRRGATAKKNESGAFRKLVRLPQYFDWAFEDETRLKRSSIAAACEKFASARCAACSTRLRRRPASRRNGPPRLRSARFDNNRRMVDYVAKRIARGNSRRSFRGRHGRLSVAEARRCVRSTPSITFRHLTTDEAALGHLRCVLERCDPAGYLYSGMHLLPLTLRSIVSSAGGPSAERRAFITTLRSSRSSRRRTRLERCRISLPS